MSAFLLSQHHAKNNVLRTDRDTLVQAEKNELNYLAACTSSEDSTLAVECE